MKPLINAEEKNLLRTKLKGLTKMHLHPVTTGFLRKHAILTFEFEKVKEQLGEEKANELLEQFKKEAYSQPDVNSTYIANRLCEIRTTQQ